MTYDYISGIQLGSRKAAEAAAAPARGKKVQLQTKKCASASMIETEEEKLKENTFVTSACVILSM